MSLIFWGLLLFSFFDFRFEGIVLNPDFVGYFLVYFGMRKVPQSGSFQRNRWVVLCAGIAAAALYCLTGFDEQGGPASVKSLAQYSMNGFTEWSGSDYWISLLLDGAAWFLLLLVTYLVAAGVRELEGVCGSGLGSEKLYSMWALLTFGGGLSLVLAMAALITEGVMLMLPILLLALAVGKIGYLVRLFQSMDRWEKLQLPSNR